MFWRGWRWRGACGGGEGQGPCCCFLRVRGASPTAHACRTALARCAEPPSWSRKALPLPKDPDPAGSWGGGAAVRAENPGQTAPVRPGGGLGRPPISAESHPPLCAKRANNGDPFGRRGRRRRRRPLELPDRRGRGERPLFRYWCGGTRGPRPLLVPPSPAVPRLFFLKISQSPRAGRPRLRSDSGGWTGGASTARLGEGGRNPRLQGRLGSRTGPGTGLSPPISAPARPPRPVRSPSGISWQHELPSSWSAEALEVPAAAERRERQTKPCRRPRGARARGGGPAAPSLPPGTPAAPAPAAPPRPPGGWVASACGRGVRGPWRNRRWRSAWAGCRRARRRWTRTGCRCTTRRSGTPGSRWRPRPGSPASTARPCCPSPSTRYAPPSPPPAAPSRRPRGR